MSIADKLLTIAENEQKVYNAGSNKGYNIGNENGYEQGLNVYYDVFWNLFQENGTRKDYANQFMKTWTNEMFKPKYDLTVLWGPGMFTDSIITGSLKTILNDCGVKLDTSQNISFSGMFYNCRFSELPVIDMSMSNASNKAFFWATYIKNIEKVIFSETTSISDNMFVGCVALENIVIEGVITKSISFSHSSKLTNESIQSIIDGLADLTGGTAQTLTLHATVKNKLTSELRAQATSKNWNIA